MKKNILLVMVGSLTIFASKVIIWLILPKMMAVEQYGYYKEFLMYLSYTMLLHFGFPDGILLIYAGKEIMDRDTFKNLSWFYIVFQSLIFGVIFFAGIVQKNAFIKLLSVDGFLVNIATYYKFLSQASLHFKDQAIRDCFQGIFQALTALLFLYVYLSRGFELTAIIWIYVLIVSDALILLFYYIKYRDITFIKISEIRLDKPLIYNIFSKGILLTLSFQISHLVFIIDRQIVDVAFDIGTYSTYSFAYSLTGLITAAAAAVSVVLFPSLKAIGEKEAVSSYSSKTNYMIKCIFFFSGFTFLLCEFICFYLPKYMDSVKYLIAIMPGVAISCAINMIIFNYFKLLDKLKTYSIIALMMLVISGILDAIVLKVIGKPIALSFASIIVLLSWIIVLERYLYLRHEVKTSNSYLYIVALLFAFYIIGYSELSWVLKMVFYFSLWGLMTFWGKMRTALSRFVSNRT